MNDNAVNLLKDLASKLGQTVEALWPHAVRYVVVDGIVGFVFCVVVGGAALYFGPKLLRWVKSDKFGEEDWQVGVMVLGGICCLLAALTCLICIPDSIIKVIEPTGYLINKAVSVSK